MITVKQNRSKASMSAKLDVALKKKAKPVIRERLLDIAYDLTRLSPVWSGAYVTSHSFVPKGSGSGRRRISNFDKGPQDASIKRNEGLQQLASDINSFDFIESGGGVFRNRSPHARGVEDGTPPARKPYNVYRTATARARARNKV